MTAQVNSTAVLGFADEFAEDPELLSAWAHAFNGDDDLTLVIYAAGWTDEELLARLGAAMAQAGIDDSPGSPDLLAIGRGLDAAGERDLADRCVAAFTRGTLRPPFDQLWRIDDGMLSELRDLLSTSQRPARISPHGALPIRSICLITKDYPPEVPGGIPRAVQMQAHMLTAAGVQVHVITKSQTGAEQVREDRGVTVHEIPEPRLEGPDGLYWFEIPLWSYVAATKFAQLDAIVRFDIVEAPDYRGEALQLDPRPETPLIVWLHSPMMVAWECDPDFVMTPGARAWHALEMAAAERADLLLAPSELLRETTSRYLGERMRPAELMPYLFDSSQFPVQREACVDGKIRALFYGRLEQRKSPELAMHAVAAAQARGIDVELTMLGRNNGAYQERVLLPLQRALGLERVTYLPHADLPALRAVLAGTDVAILASRFDNSPLTIFEALSSGVPVITSDRVGTSSWIAPEDGLLALPIGDPGRFAVAAAAAIADRDWMASGSRAAARMRNDFSPAVVTQRLLDCYARLLATHRPATRRPAAELMARVAA